VFGQENVADDYTAELAYDFLYDPTITPIFGLDFLGWGFDATYRDPFYALKPQLFKFSFNNPPKGKEKTYRYPIDVQTYAVPDQVFVRTVAKTTTDTYTFLNSKQKRFFIDGRLDIKVSTKQIEGELNVAIEYIKESEKNQSYVMNLAETSLFQLYLGNRILRGEIKKAMKELTGTYTLDKTTFELFLAKYGTHYVDSVVIGGSVLQETRIRFNTELEKFQLTASLKGKFESSSGRSPGDSNVANSSSSGGGGGGGGTVIQGEINFKLEDIERKIQTETTSRSEIYGGDPEFTDFVLTAGDPAATRLLFESWKSPLLTNPIGIRYRLVEVWSLFEDTLQQKEVCTATATLLGFLPDEDPNYCDSAGRLLGGTIRGGLQPPPKKGALQ
jgi:hypothetical protein